MIIHYLSQSDVTIVHHTRSLHSHIVRILTLFQRVSRGQLHMVRRLKVPPHVTLVAVFKIAVEAEEHSDPDGLNHHLLVLLLDAGALRVLESVQQSYS